MKTVELGALVAPAQVQRARNTDYPVLSMTMHDGLVAQTDRFKKRIASLDTSDYKVVRRGQLVVGFPINEGVLDFQLHHDAALVSPAYGVWNLRDESLADRAYLKRFLKSPRAIEYYVGKMKGSTARRRSLPPAEFNAMPIPLPPLTEQRRIAAILDHADALRTTRRQVLTKLDALTQSIFHDMFSRTAQLDSAPLKDLIKWKSGKFLPAKEQHGGVYPVYGGNGVNGWHDEYTYEEPRLVVGRVGAYCGAVHITQPHAWVTDNALIATLLRDDLTLGYLLPALTLANLNQYAGVSGQPSISAGKIGGVRLPVPAVDLQHEFAGRVQRIDSQRGAVQRANTAADALFASFQSCAFRGEL
ncbi:restriction endonuclease subunit S [Nocardioides kribbensis]|uniref:restriction endonuclease subunit S n=1 Tax=Nocardioides kribbensis TaxID=305517 RepID=UPI00187A5733|nr:restriction endonuclease subunit S [Nocardioides kribbensis]